MAHTFNPGILRAYDIRGVVGKDLSATDAYWVGRGFGNAIRSNEKSTVAVGRDGRLTSPELCAEVIRGLKEAGCHVKDIGLCPSPMLYFSEYELETDAALMVTGSHNPSDYNGFKMCIGHKSFYGDDILNMARLVEKGELSSGTGTTEEVDIQDKYIKKILETVPQEFSLKVVWDPGNGAGSDIVSQLVKTLPGTHIVINGQIDGTFPAHHPDPTIPANLVQLQEEVKKQGADIGLAFDGDADRLGAVDSEGRIFWGDQLLMLLARDILKGNPNATVIADVKASSAFFDDVTAHNGHPLMWKSGHSHIKTKMRETKALLAGEMSGHIFIADNFYGFDDGIYSALRLLNMIHKSGLTPAELYDSLPQTYATEEIRLPCDAQRKFEVAGEMISALETEGVKFSDIDGVRANLDQGWWLLRASNTQDEIVIRCEGGDPSQLNQTIEHLAGHMDRCGFDNSTIDKVESCKL